jgi:OOP family OmpA-OmpF porin
MRLSRSIVAAVCLVAAAVAPAAAQEDEEGCTDHPMFSRMPGYYIASCEEQEFSRFEFELADGYQTVEGHYWRLDFWIKEGAKAPGPLQIGRNYWNAVASRGGARLVEQFDSGGGTLTARMPGPQGSGTIWIQIGVGNGGEGYSLNVVQEAAMRQDVAFTAAGLADALAKTGSVTLNNILFDTGKATIKAESEGPLDTVAELLKSNPSLKLEIQGHTDNTGTKDGNLRLSKDRADAVKAYLVQKGGIAGDRLTTAGLGDTQPVADNATEEGRAQNRRVVLVRKG